MSHLDIVAHSATTSPARLDDGLGAPSSWRPPWLVTSMRIGTAFQRRSAASSLSIMPLIISLRRPTNSLISGYIGPAQAPGRTCSAVQESSEDKSLTLFGMADNIAESVPRGVQHSHDTTAWLGGQVDQVGDGGLGRVRKGRFLGPYGAEPSTCKSASESQRQAVGRLQRAVDEVFA